MGDAARHIRPCGRTLGDDEIGDVVEGDDVAVTAVAGILTGHLHIQRPFLAAPHDVDLLAEVAARPGVGLVDDLFDLRRDLRQLRADKLLGGLRQEFFARWIDDGDPAVLIDPDDGGRDARKYRLDETTAIVDIVLGLDDLFLLAAQFRDHLVEGARQSPDVAIHGADGHQHMHVAGGDTVGRADEETDRPYDTVGDRNRRPDGGEKHDQRETEIKDREGDLQRRAARLHRLVFGTVLLHQPHRTHHLGIDGANRVKEGAADAFELDNGADEVGDTGRYQRRLAGGRLFKRVLRDGGKRFFGLDVGLSNGVAVLLHQERAEKAAPLGLPGHQIDEAGAIEIKKRAVAVEVGRHRQGLALKITGILHHIGLGDIAR